MSDKQPPNELSQTKPKHAGGRPRKPVPPPPPPHNSLEETLLLGDQAAVNASAVARLRWCSDRAQIVREIQARADAERRDTLGTENKRLRARVETLEREKESHPGKDAEFAKARTENEMLRKESREKTEEHNKEVAMLTEQVSAASRRAEGLLGVAKYATLQVKGLSESERVEYAAQMMYFIYKQVEESRRLTTLLKEPEANEENCAPRYQEFPTGAIEIKRNEREEAGWLGEKKATISESMLPDAETLALARSNLIPGEAKVCPDFCVNDQVLFLGTGCWGRGQFGVHPKSETRN